MEHMNYTYRKKHSRLGILLVLLTFTLVVFTNLCKPNELNAENHRQLRSKWGFPKNLIMETVISGIEKINDQSNTMNTDWHSEERYLLAKIVMAEAEGESTEGKAMIIMVVLNRVESEDFPDTIQEVIFQNNNGTYQFSPLEPGGRWWTTEPNEECYAAVDMVLMDKWDESQGALYFESIRNGKNTWHSRNLEYIKTIGNHNFYK